MSTTMSQKGRYERWGHFKGSCKEFVNHHQIVQRPDNRIMKANTVPLKSNAYYIAGIVSHDENHYPPNTFTSANKKSKKRLLSHHSHPTKNNNSGTKTSDINQDQPKKATTSTTTDTFVINPYFSRFKSRSETDFFFDSLQRNQSFVNSHSMWQFTIYELFHQTLSRDRLFIDREYDLFIHLTTHPNSPQIWRRIKVHGSITLKEFCIILKKTMGWGAHGSQFRLQLQTLANIFPKTVDIKRIIDKFKRKGNYHPLFEKYIAFGSKFDKSLDETCWRNVLGECYEMDEILFGQIAPYFQPFTKFKSVPKDMFMKQYFRSFDKRLSQIANEKYGFEYDNGKDNNLHLKNAIWNRFDCFQWVYDICKRVVWGQLRAATVVSDIFSCGFFVFFF